MLISDHSTARVGLARLLNAQPGIVVSAEVDVEGQVLACAARIRPRVALFNTGHMIGQVLPLAEELRARTPGCAVVVLADPATRGTLPPRRQARTLSFLVRDTQLPLLADAIHRVAQGERVVDPHLEIASLKLDRAVSTRELEILALAAQGDSVADIARRLRLSLGTVRNYISAAIAKTGARNRLDAIRIVRRDGWIR